MSMNNNDLQYLYSLSLVGCGSARDWGWGNAIISSMALTGKPLCKRLNLALQSSRYAFLDAHILLILINHCLNIFKLVESIVQNFQYGVEWLLHVRYSFNMPLYIFFRTSDWVPIYIYGTIKRMNIIIYVVRRIRINIKKLRIVKNRKRKIF
jgi:hypothetical protein